MKIIPHNMPCIDEKEIDAVKRVLQNKWIIEGKEVEKFENNFKNFIGTKYAIATNSGTAALHLSLLSLGIHDGDEIITASYTSADVLNAIGYVRAKPVLADLGKLSCTIDLEDIEKKITRKTKAMIIPHTFGFPVDIPVLEKYSIPIIEDCAQCVGSTLHTKTVGTFGALSIFSFFATKLLTTGQGGMVLTDDKAKYEYIKDLISYNGRNNYKIRYNYPLTDIGASIGNIQLKKYIHLSKRRKAIAQEYQRILERKNIFHMPRKEEISIVPFRFLFQCQNEKHLGEIMDTFLRHGIIAKQPIVPHELLHRLLDEDRKKFLQTELFAKTMLSLPVYPCLTEGGIRRITQVLSEYL